MDPLFVGGGFENFNWLAEFAVQIPIFAAIYYIFTCRAIGPMKFAVQQPFFAAICPFNRRAIDPMKFAIQIPFFGAIGGNFANWLLVTHTQL